MGSLSGGISARSEKLFPEPTDKADSDIIGSVITGLDLDATGPDATGSAIMGSTAIRGDSCLDSGPAPAASCDSGFITSKSLIILAPEFESVLEVAFTGVL